MALEFSQSAVLEFKPLFPMLQPASLRDQSSDRNTTQSLTTPPVNPLPNITWVEYLTIKDIGSYLCLKIHSGKRRSAENSQQNEQERRCSYCDSGHSLSVRGGDKSRSEAGKTAASNSPPDSQKTDHDLQDTRQVCDRILSTCPDDAGTHQSHLKQHLPNPRPLQLAGSPHHPPLPPPPQITQHSDLEK